MNIQEISALGKHGNIWLVYDRDSGRVYVRKCLEVFNRKIYEWLRHVSYLHIPQVIWCEEEDGKLYIIEEYINGETLEERLHRVHHLQENEALPLLLEIVQALAFLHHQNPPIIHRDVKLSNIMISNDGVVKLIDYNAARYYDLGMTQDTAMIGTAGYAAPEQFGFAQTDARTDIYAFGVVMNYLLTGVHIRNGLYQGTLGKIIRKCTQIDPEKRFQNMEEVEEALQISARFLQDAKEIYRDVKGNGEEKVCTELWSAPGLKKGNWGKSIAAVIGCFCIYFLLIGLEWRGFPEGMVSWLKRNSIGISILFFVAMMVDYSIASRYIPLMRHSKPYMRFFGYVLFGLLGLCVLFLFDLFLENVLNRM